MRCTNASAGSPNRAWLERYVETFRGPSLPGRRRRERGGAPPRSARPRRCARHFPIGNAVDFWTEASLFSAAGLTALVYRPRRHRPGPHRRRMGGAEQLRSGDITAECGSDSNRSIRALPTMQQRRSYGHIRAKADQTEYARPSCACFQHGQREGNRSTSSASPSSTPRASPWSKSVAPCCATISTR